MNTHRHNNTHIHILLDRSGSMGRIADDVIGGFNEFLRSQQESGPDARVTFVQFDTREPQEVIMAGAPITEARPLTRKDYQPRGCTPLLDATGMLIERAKAEAGERKAQGLQKEDIVFVSITDGHENASREFTLAQIRELVKACEAEGWTFVFLSAALDVYGEARSMGVKGGSTQAFRATPDGTRRAFGSLSGKMSEFRDKKRSGLDAEKDDFFGKDKPAEEDRNEPS
jgi:Mg-chelatase subunit ChlD